MFLVWTKDKSNNSGTKHKILKLFFYQKILVDW
jgi:hypothetical protein